MHKLRNSIIGKHKLLPRLRRRNPAGVRGAAVCRFAEIILGSAGTSASAVITDIRREGGERTDGKPGRYTDNISYKFALTDGKEVNGFTKRIGDSVYLKVDGTTTVWVRYSPAFPSVNALERDAELGSRQVIMMLAGGFLILVMTAKRGGDD